MISPLVDGRSKLIECSSALSKSGLYDIDYALNPYRGCSHGCLYCYAPDVIRCERGDSWGSWVEARTNISRVLRKEIAGIGKAKIGLATVTDPYQPAEKRFELTRSCLEVIARSDASLMLMTKSPLVLRDLDLLKQIKDLELCTTITTLDASISSILEPGAPPPSLRLGILRAGALAGIRTNVMISPLLMAPEGIERDLTALMELILESGCRSVTIDRLRMRPCATKRLESRLGSIQDVRLKKNLQGVMKSSESFSADALISDLSLKKRFPKMTFEIPDIG